MRFATKTKQNLSGLPLHESLWEDQKSAILESYSAWVVYENNYGDASGRLGGLIAARKATRDFAAKAMAPAGIPKSSLDGANESVINLPHNKRGNNPLMQRLGLTGGEELDVLGVIKRAAGNVEQFTPFSRIAADAWLSDLTKQKLEALCKQYEVFVNAGTATRVKGNSGCYQKFPYDSQLLFPARLDNARAEASTQHTDLAPLDSLKTLLNSLKESPVPYGVLLKADGDKMGKLLSRATSIEQARVVSGVLHEFARSVRQILRRHNGHAVYAGGDDILAFLPLQTALDCAKELAIEFAQRTRPGREAPLGRPTRGRHRPRDQLTDPNRLGQHRVPEGEPWRVAVGRRNRRVRSTGRRTSSRSETPRAPPPQRRRRDRGLLRGAASRDRDRPGNAGHVAPGQAAARTHRSKRVARQRDHADTQPLEVRGGARGRRRPRPADGGGSDQRG